MCVRVCVRVHAGGRKQHEGPRDVLGEARAAALGGDGSLGAGVA